MQVGIVAPLSVGKTTLIELIALWALERVPVYDKQGAGSFCEPKQLEAMRLAGVAGVAPPACPQVQTVHSSICKIS